jgi:hypothetical protein
MGVFIDVVLFEDIEMIYSQILAVSLFKKCWSTGVQGSHLDCQQLLKEFSFDLEELNPEPFNRG